MFCILNVWVAIVIVSMMLTLICTLLHCLCYLRRIRLSFFLLCYFMQNELILLPPLQAWTNWPIDHDRDRSVRSGHLYVHDRWFSWPIGHYIFSCILIVIFVLVIVLANVYHLYICIYICNRSSRSDDWPIGQNLDQN